MNKLYDLGLICGRFNHAQLGHNILFESSLKLCNQTLVLIGSAQESLTLRNPFSLETRINVIRKIFPNESEKTLIIKGINDLTNEFDITFEWGKYVKSEVQHHMNKFADLMISGNDESRKNWFAPEDIENTSMLTISRNKFKISATDVRGFLLINDKENWKKYSHPLTYNLYDELRNELLTVPAYKQIYDLYKDNLNLENFKKHYKILEIQDRAIKLKNNMKS